ncbi:hypothetical protein ACHQM5_003998 [Ranunculus cassubicifolius]
MSSESKTNSTNLPDLVMQKDGVERTETTNNRVEEKEKEVESSETTNNRVEEKEEEGECGFCLYMKGGSCKDMFTAYDKCLDDNEGEERNSKCAELGQALANCMSENVDYYGPIMEVMMKAFAVSKESKVEKEVVGEETVEKLPVEEEEKKEEPPVEETKEKPTVEETKEKPTVEETKDGNPKPRFSLFGLF